MPLIGTRGAASSRGFGRFGGGGVPGTVTTALLDGSTILSGYGLMIYSNGNNYVSESTPGAVATTSFVVPANVTKIRAIAIGGGGGSTGSENVIGGDGGAGIEAFITVTPGETLTIGVGKGGSCNVSSGSGGHSYIKRGGTTLIQGNGGNSAVQYDSSRNTSTSYDSTAGSVSVISIGYGGRGHADNSENRSDSAALSYQVNLSGATAHGGGGGVWSNGVGSPGYGLGFGGGGGFANGNFTPNGGTYGYSGTYCNSSTTYGKDSVGPAAFSNQPGGGACGGSFGGGGVDGWFGGAGAGGLVRIWWASTSGDPTWIDTGGNY